MSNGQQNGGLPTTTGPTTVSQTDTNYFRLKFFFAFGGRIKLGQWTIKIDIQTSYNLNEDNFKTKIILPWENALSPLHVPQVNFMRCVATTAQKGDSVKPYNPNNIRRVNLTQVGRFNLQDSEPVSLDNCLYLGIDTITGRQCGVNLRGALREKDISAAGSGKPALVGDILLPQYLNDLNQFISGATNDFTLGVFEEIPATATTQAVSYFRQATGMSMIGVSQRPVSINRLSQSARLKKAQAEVAKLTAATTP